MTVWSKRKIVGLRFPFWTPHTPRVASGVVDSMRLHEDLWRLVTEYDSYGELEGIKLNQDWQGNGLILYRATGEELAAWRARGMAVVLTSSEGPDGGFPRVLPDNGEIGRLAARHLVECHLPHFAFLARSETLYKETDLAPGARVYPHLRLRGFQEELGQYSIEPTVHYLAGRPLWLPETWRQLQDDVARFLATLPEPCGLFAVDDALAAVVLNAAAEMGKQVPDQLAVIGYGDDPNFCYSTYPALTSITHPAQTIGFYAAGALRRQMRGERDGVKTQIVPVSHVIQRESTAVIAVADPKIRELVAWIRREAPHDALRVSDLAERAKISLTQLKRGFAEHLGHSPKREITRVRLECLKHLLCSTTLSLIQIAGRMKFTSANELSRFFRAETGMRPQDFREGRAPSRTEAE